MATFRRLGIAALTIVSLVYIAHSEIDGACARCAKWVKLSDKGAGFDRRWEGLCIACQDPERRCRDAVVDLERRIDKRRDQVGYCRTELDLANGYRSELGGEATMPGERLSIDEFIRDVTSTLEDLERDLADLRRRLAAMKAECEGRGDVAGGGGNGSGTSPAEAARSIRQQVEQLNQRSQRLIEQIRKLEAQPGASAAVQATSAPIEASQLDGVQLYMKPLVDAMRTQVPTPAGGGMKAEGQPASASQEEVIRPTLVDMRADLPKPPVARGFALSQRHTANAAAYADALLESIGQVDAARAAGDPDRAHRHLERAAYLSAMGQRELRQAAAEQAGALRRLYSGSRDFAMQAKKNGKTVEEALAGWQADVRANGLPAQYVANLEKAGVSADEIAKRREWLQGVDAGEAARTHNRFMRLLAPLYLPEARGRGNSPDPLPEADDLWDLVTIMLLHSR